MADSARDMLVEIVPAKLLDAIDRAILDGIKTASLYKITIEMKQYRIQNVFVTTNILVADGEDNLAA